ncbi:zinc finger BED domain-containing protein 6-like [Rhinatrema bivittatum]|uniref:zinc finger BED domain-containing protein 6-like n=1 Tax=Rhinatrema bivittatum TaxID=194408 RepID=UPI00112B2E65|nr:zinc finger BED domain-containing protein 6-like [Rhinatrema bivittatum]XP_029443925.1 zinc finger BED domain-containing protein 6-like [Rhinatrema bivittatum]
MQRKRRGIGAPAPSSALHSPLLRASAVAGHLDFALRAANYPLTMPSVAEFGLHRASVGLSQSEYVPEIEIKLESSEEEEEERKAGRGILADTLSHAFGQDGSGKIKMEFFPRGMGPQGSNSCIQLEKSPAEMEDLAANQKDSLAFHLPSRQLRPLVHRGRKSTSQVWQFFYCDPMDICRAICGLCGVSFSRGKPEGNFGTTALKRHLERKHPLEWGQREEAKQKATSRGGGEEEEEDEEEEEEREEQYEKIFPAPHQIFSAQRASCFSPQAPGVVAAQVLSGAAAMFDYSDTSEEGEEEEEKERAEMVGTELLFESGDEAGAERQANLFARGRGRGSKTCGKYARKPRDMVKSFLGGAPLDHSSLGSRFPTYPLVPPGTKRRKSTSAVWQFFYIDCTNICRAICTLCQTSVSRGKQGGHFGTSALMRHLEGKHPLEWGRGKTVKPKIGIGEGEEEEEEDQTAEEPLEELFPASSHLFSPLKSLGFNAQSQFPAVLPSEVQNTPPSYDSSESETALKQKRKRNDPCPTGLSPVRSKQTLPERVDFNGKYTPNHPRAQSWNRSIAELLCGMALPYSFISSKPFHKFMARADPRYRVPSRAFFSRKAIPQLHEAVCERIAYDLKRAEGHRVHITVHVCTSDVTVDYLAITAHWVVFKPEGQESNKRKQAVLSIKGIPKDQVECNVRQELGDQIDAWLTPSSLSHGFLVSGNSSNVIRAMKDSSFVHIPCFAHCLNLLVTDFLQGNCQVANVLGVADKICGHFTHSIRARRILAELQHQNGLPRHQLKQEMTPRWSSMYHMLERLLEQQKAVQEYIGRHRIGMPDIVLTSAHWNLIANLVALLQPFEMAMQEVSADNASLSQVLPEVRYLHIFLKQIHDQFEIKGDGSGVVLAENLALKLSTDCRINEMFHREEYILATLLDPRFKGKIEAVLPIGSDIDHWKQVLVKKVKDVMLLECPSPSPSSSSSSFNRPVASTQAVRESYYDAEPMQATEQPYDMETGMADASGAWRKASVAPPLIQKEKTLIEHLESVGLLASKGSGASLSTESHSACVMVEKYLHDNKTIGAREDPLMYWEKKRWLWPALAKLGVLYLTCPPSSGFSERLFNASEGLVYSQKTPIDSESVERLIFLKANLENFPNYTQPPLVFCSENEMERSSSEEE